ncbi:YwpF family protein [Alteribacillus iranensis]|uniref:YwpF-like protein n=1 Tax=Alteribacillus iranensis TaxID=930128 RepID=A0A1I2ERU4_9BACI|nr:YwpF family protein [Alteribacillus iranensis]SFE95158.1 YwpF-like protein [Alteribacillus iranensis]
MKTFRLVSLKLLLMKQGTVEEKVVPLQEGLIINREEKDGSWLIEAVIPHEERDFFEKIKNEKNKLVMEVLITDRKNEPAMMAGEVKKTVTLSEKISVMIVAKMTSGKEDISNLILQELIHAGYNGESLLEEFTNRKEDKAEWSRKLAENIYASFDS